MGSLDSSPNHVKATRGSGVKKKNSSGGIECDDSISITSSTGISAVNGPYVANLHNTGIKFRSNNKKTQKTFGSVMSFRRRAKARIIHPPAAVSDDSGTSHADSWVDSADSVPHYLMETSCSQGKKTHSHLSPQRSESLFDSSDKHSSVVSQSMLVYPSRKPVQTLSRTPSFRKMRFLVKKTSFKQRRTVLNNLKDSENLAFDSATYSSTVKDSKFAEPVEPLQVGTESENISSMKVCRYHHCSLHGHCHGTRDPVPQPKRSLYKRRWSMKKQRSMKPKRGSLLSTDRASDRIPETRLRPKEESIYQESTQNCIASSGVENENALSSHAEINSKEEAWLIGDGHNGIHASDFIEVAFGETAFPERSYQENLSILRKYSIEKEDFQEQTFGRNDHCLSCSCNKQEQDMPTMRRDYELRECADVLSSSSSNCFNRPKGQISNPGEDNVALSFANQAFNEDQGQVNDPGEDSAALSFANKASNEGHPEIPVTVNEMAEKNDTASSPSDSQSSSHNNSDGEGGDNTESMLDGDSKFDEGLQVKVSAVDTSTHSGGKLLFSKQRHISMWHLIHQHMSSNLGAEQAENPLHHHNSENPADNASTLGAKGSTASLRDLPDSDMGAVNNEPEIHDIELRKLFAIKLVREAIDKILLPEVQDQISDDQSVASESTPRGVEAVEKNQNQVFMQDHRDEDNASVLEIKKTDNASVLEIKKTDNASVLEIKKTDNASVSEKTDDASVLEIKNTDDASVLEIKNTDGPEIKKNEKKIVSKLGNKAPKHWSNLKKWILLQRFIRELEKVRKLNLRRPQLLPLNPDPEAEKVNLRRQTVDARKKSDEWMLDYALRQAVNQLAPTQKKKVALLVKAFETVVPPDDSHIQFRIPKLQDNGTDTSDPNYEVNEPASEGPGSVTGNRSSTEKSLTIDGDGKLGAMENNCDPSSHSGTVNLDKTNANETEREAMPVPQGLRWDAASGVQSNDSGPVSNHVDSTKHFKMWHMIYQHVVSDIAEKVGSRLLDGAEDDELPAIGTNNSRSPSSSFTKSDVLKLIKDAVDEIILPENQDDSSAVQSVTSESTAEPDISERNFNDIGGQDLGSETELLMDAEGNTSRHGETTPKVDDENAKSYINSKPELPKSKNWSKLKKLMLLKRSIKALEKARNLKKQSHQLPPQIADPEQEKIDLRSQMMDERKRAEQWMLDYAVQHIVTKLTPARKRRVSMLVEAFEAVVPLPDV